MIHNEPFIRKMLFELVGGIFLLIALYAMDLVGNMPWWIVALILIALVLTSTPPIRPWMLANRTCQRLDLVSGVTAILCVGLIYMIGWGPLLVAALLTTVTVEVRYRGGSVWRSMLGWLIVSAFVAQTLVWTGLLESPLPVNVGTGAFAIGMVVLVQFSRAYGMAIERMEEEVAARSAAEARFRSLVQNAHETVAVMDPAGKLTYVSPSAEHVIGYTPRQLLDDGWMHLLHPDDLVTARRSLHKVVTTGKTAIDEIRGMTQDGDWRWWEVVTSNRLDEPAVQAIVCNIRDVTERHLFQEQLAYQANRDSLTGLLNRKAFLEALDGELARVRRQHRTIALLFLDLNDFKLVNDHWGHAAGDLLLQTVANRIQSAVRPGDTTGRLGGDEFTVLLTDLDSEDRVELVAERVREAVETPMIFDGNKLETSVSIGIAVTAAGAESAHELIRAADMQMYETKQGRAED